MESTRERCSVLYCLCAGFLANSFVRYFSPGNVYSTGSSDSMKPIVSPHEYLYVSEIRQDYQFGDLVTYKDATEDLPSLGIICGLGGDAISVEGLNIYRNQTITDCGIKNFVRLQPVSMNEIKLPENSIFIAKPNGFDSSFQDKTFLQDNIKGKVLFAIRDLPLGPWVQIFFKIFRV